MKSATMVTIQMVLVDSVIVQEKSMVTTAQEEMKTKTITELSNVEMVISHQMSSVKTI